MGIVERIKEKLETSRLLAGYMKGQMSIGNLVPFAVMFVVAVLVVGFGATILSGVQTSAQAADHNASNSSTWTYAYNITGDGLTGLSNMSGQFGNLGLIVVAAVIIGVLGLLVYATRGQRY